MMMMMMMMMMRRRRRIMMMMYYIYNRFIKNHKHLIEMAGQSDPHPSLFSAEEIEFMGEDEMIEFVPNMRMEPLNLISGDYGPFFPQMVTQVPLWLEIALKKRGKCAIRPPSWMSIGWDHIKHYEIQILKKLTEN
ncbi:DNA replication complex GINS protein PSF2-like isoform X2 [Humulus lupulus]|uniref:DNA replication complex GINS protein PSF2-like isoform X2 n=1 Tax=Humulus lupulus TaxID=3486 RepID=UPI002B405ABA|nr:DNA replication complex GINS protein PSF2-like isoform X2 [Humulus lupulus]